MATQNNWQKAFKDLEVFEEPRRIVEQYDFRIGGVGPIPIIVYETMEKDFEATTPGWQRCFTQGTGMSATEMCTPLTGTGGNARAALENLLSKIPAIKGTVWKRMGE